VIETQTIRRSRAGGDYAMTNDKTKPSVSQSEAETAIGLLDEWFDPIEAALRDQVRGFIQAMIEAELEAVLARPRYGRRPTTIPGDIDGPERITGHRHGHRSRSLIGTFG
jgi:putative transposase